jgi:hypothetical protein
MATKVAALATVLLLGIILPAYTSGQCHRGNLVGEDNIVRGCATTAYNVTNYERTTIANVPSILDVDDPKVGFFVSENGILRRLYAVNFVVWIVTAYFCYCLKYEWIEILAMRRVYYLERDVWEERRAELRNTLLHSEAKERDRKRQTHFTFEQTRKYKEEEEKHLVDRDPWIPHPEQRDVSQCQATSPVASSSRLTLFDVRPNLLRRRSPTLPCIPFWSEAYLPYPIKLPTPLIPGKR